MHWARHPEAASSDPALDVVTAALDPVLLPLGFAAGQTGQTGDEAQVIFCRGDVDSLDGGCVDLVVVLHAVPAWRIVEVRYWGFPADRWQLPFEHDAPLLEQVRDLAQTLPAQLSPGR